VTQNTVEAAFSEAFVARLQALENNSTQEAASPALAKLASAYSLTAEDLGAEPEAEAVPSYDDLVTKLAFSFKSMKKGLRGAARSAGKQVKSVTKGVSKTWKKLPTGGKVGVISGAAGLGAGAAMLAKKLHSEKED